jgi:hypothetical protein
MAKISTYFGLDKLLNEILTFLFEPRPRLHQWLHLAWNAGIDSRLPTGTREDWRNHEHRSGLSALPHVLHEGSGICHLSTTKGSIYQGSCLPESASAGLKIVRTFPGVDAWPSLIEVLCGLRDARALPAGLAKSHRRLCG